MMTDLLGVCISQVPLEWSLPYPLLVHTGGWEAFTDESDPFARIQYLAKRRNDAVTLGLEKYPSTRHVMMIDSYYVHQSQPLLRLIDDYNRLGGDCIMGAVTWGKNRVRLSSWLRPQVDFFDKWAFPDLRFVPYGWDPSKDIITSWFRPPLKGLYHVCSVGGCYIFPRKVWDSGVRYQAIPDLHGCEHNWFCEHSRVDCWADFNAPIWREKTYSFVKCVRCSLGYWKRRVSPNADKVP